jgi:hypothetical protein
VPEEYKPWLKQQIAWSNELSLKQRLEELYDHAEIVLKHLVVNRDAFIKRVRDTRNYYTHYSASLRKKAADGIELHWITEVLRYVISFSLLYELDFEPEKIEKLLLRNRSFKALNSKLKEFEKNW